MTIHKGEDETRHMERWNRPNRSLAEMECACTRAIEYLLGRHKNSAPYAGRMWRRKVEVITLLFMKGRMR
jgi:hypothetical protein